MDMPIRSESRHSCESKYTSILDRSMWILFRIHKHSKIQCSLYLTVEKEQWSCERGVGARGCHPQIESWIETSARGSKISEGENGEGDGGLTKEQNEEVVDCAYRYISAGEIAELNIGNITLTKLQALHKIFKDLVKKKGEENDGGNNMAEMNAIKIKNESNDDGAISWNFNCNI